MNTVIFVLISGFLPLVLSSSGSCPDGWTLFRDSCIFISSEMSSWDQANSNCTSKSNSSKLLNIQDQKENDLAKEMLTNFTKNLNTSEMFYFGLYGRKLNSSNQLNSSSQLTFNWTDIETVYNFSNWRFTNETAGTLLNVGDRLCAFYDNETFMWRLGNCTRKAKYICQQNKHQAVSGAGQAPSSTSKPPKCGIGWYETKHYCIYLSNTTKTWHDAYHDCRALQNHSHLVILWTKEKDVEVLNVLKNNTTPSQFYIGLYRRKTEMRFLWITGQMYNYTNWFSANETKRPAANGENSLCAYYGTDYKWHLDNGCSTPRRYICQRRTKYYPRPNSIQENTNKPNENTPAPTTPPPLTTTPPPPTATPGKDRWAQAVDWRIKNLTGKPISEEKATEELEATMKDLSSSFSRNSTGEMSVQNVQNLIELAEKMGDVLIQGMKKAGNLTEPKRIQVKNDVMVLGVVLMPANSSSIVQFPQNSSGGSIKLPGSVIQLAGKSQNASDGIGLTSLFLPDVGGGKKPDGKKPTLNSGIMSTKVAVADGTIQNLKEPVVIILPHAKKLESHEKAVCNFIDPQRSKYSTAGCNVDKDLSNSTQTVCRCNHLTSFAVLLDVHDNVNQTPTEHQLPLLVVSVIGCCIALVCFVAALIAFHLVISERRRRKTETVAIHKNLAVAEILALMFFLLAYGVSKPEGLCFGIAFLLHYSLMAVFFWMLVEGLNLHRGTVQVFMTTSRMKVYYILGWGTPWVFVITTAAIGQMEYARDDFCWISQRFIWAFAGPVCVILLINFVILCIAIRVMVKRPRYKSNRVNDSSKSTTEQELRIAFKTTVILLPLLGLTWCLGFISTHTVVGNTVIQYIFAIVNTLQGVYFFLAHCMYDEDVIRATNNTSTRVKTYFSRTLSRTNPSNTSTSVGVRSNSGHNDSAYKKKGKDVVFEMPSLPVSSRGTHSIPSPENHKYIDNNGDITSKTNDTSTIVSIPVPDIRAYSNRVSSGSSASECSESIPVENKDLGTVKEDVGSPGQVFFRRAKSAINDKLSKKTTVPRRSHSIAAESPRMKLSKQTSNDSNVSGTSNTAFLRC